MTSTAVHVAPAAVTPVTETFEAGGIVEARTTAAVSSRLLAPVLSVHVAAGDRVRAGQLLVRLDAREVDAGRQRAVAAADAMARAAAVAKSEREGAEASLALARATHGRISSLHERRAATPHELDEAVSGLRGAEARLQAIEARVAESEAGIAAARAAAAAAEATASYAAIAAPFDGVVTDVTAEPGNLAAPGSPLLQIEDAAGRRLEVRVDASRARLIAPGQPADVLLDAADAVPVRGRVGEVARAVQAGSQLFAVKIDLPPGTEVRSGTFARARFERGVREALTVPADAIVRRGQLPTVFVVQNGRARLRVISTGEDRSDRIEVLSGIATGEPVIVVPPLGLRDGDRVTPGPARSAEGGR